MGGAQFLFAPSFWDTVLGVALVIGLLFAVKVIEATEWVDSCRSLKSCLIFLLLKINFNGFALNIGTNEEIKETFNGAATGSLPECQVILCTI